MRRMRIALPVLLATLACAATSLWAQEDEADLVFQTERTDAYEAYLDAREDDLYTQLDAGDEVDAARMSLILVKLARIQQEASAADEAIADATEEIDEALADLGELLGDEIDEEDPEDLGELLDAIASSFDDDPEFEAEVDAIEERIDIANGDIESALDDLGAVLEDEAGDIADLAEELRDSDGDFEVTFQVEVDGDVEELTITRADLDDLEAAGESLADAFDELDSAAEAWADALDWLDIAESADDNQQAIEAMRAAIGHLNTSLLSLEEAFDGPPLEVGLDTYEVRELLTDIDDILGGRTFAIGERTVRPVALIESRTTAAWLSDDLMEAAILLSLMAESELVDADDHEWWAQFLEEIEEEEDAAYYRTRAAKAQTRAWTWVLLAASAVGLSDPADDLLIEFWSSSTPADETLRGYFPEGMSPAMLEVLGVDLVVNTSATRDEMDTHMAGMRASFEARLAQDPWNAEARAGLAVARTWFLVADNHGDVLDVIDMTIEGDIVGIVDRFDTEDFDYSASLDSTDLDLDIANDDEDLVFLVLDKLDDDGNRFRIEVDDEVIPLPLTGDVLEAGLGIVGALAAAATGLAEAGGEALERVEDALELDLDPNELDFTDADEPLDVALALERSNPDFGRMSPEGAADMADMGDGIEDALTEFSDAVTEFRDLAVELEEEAGADLQGVAEFAEELDDRYQEMREDFVDPSATSQVDGEEVNMSAWFDHPPEQMLQQFIWYLDDDDDTDNTLGGLLPGRRVDSVVLESRAAAVPEEFALGQNFPNPFNAGTVIEFDLPTAADVSLRIYDVLGQEVLRLSEGRRQAGSYRVLWDGTDAVGEPLASGVYHYRLRTGERTQTRSLLLLR